MRNESYSSNSPEQTHQIAVRLGAILPLNTVVSFAGDLGAGKTTFIRGLAEGAARIDPREVCSPTFTYLHIYTGKKTIYHFDLYRLKSSEEFFAAGFGDFLLTGGITCIEWADKIAPFLPEKRVHIELVHSGQEKRDIQVTWS